MITARVCSGFQHGGLRNVARTGLANSGGQGQRRRILQSESSGLPYVLKIKYGHLCQSNLRHGLPHLSSWAGFVTHSFLSSAVSPDLSSKSGSTGMAAAADQAQQDTITVEEKSEPVKGVDSTPDGEKGEDLVSMKDKEDVPAEGKSANQEIEAEHKTLEENEADLLALLGEREALLEEKEKTIEALKEKVMRSYAEVQNILDRGQREAESSRKYAVQSFAKGLLDVADNLGRAAAAVPEEFRKSDGPEDPSGAAKLLISLLLGVEMTEKQLIQVFKANGLERYESLGEPFDPNLHSAVFEVEDLSKTPGTVAIVLKVGYKLYDRVIRPAEVGVVKAQ
ncbi:unnamed protein product [Sphagnum troendelagicum]|uniref:GrpE protein homolog n=1 Tax=Sphagnum troendelagicum TaxID=128251 RepID=A0ABP0V7F6_9BRYO